MYVSVWDGKYFCLYYCSNMCCVGRPDQICSAVTLSGLENRDRSCFPLDCQRDNTVDTELN